jgi:hypothetical protein
MYLQDVSFGTAPRQRCTVWLFASCWVAAKHRRCKGAHRHESRAEATARVVAVSNVRSSAVAMARFQS